jgi:acyl carrier protein
MTLEQNKLIEIVSDVCSLDSPIDMSTKLVDLELDSLDFLELHMMIEEAFSVEISVNKFLSCNTLSDVLELIVCE